MFGVWCLECIWGHRGQASVRKPIAPFEAFCALRFVRLLSLRGGTRAGSPPTSPAVEPAGKCAFCCHIRRPGGSAREAAHRRADKRPGFFDSRTNPLVHSRGPPEWGKFNRKPDGDVGGGGGARSSKAKKKKNSKKKLREPQQANGRNSGAASDDGDDGEAPTTTKRLERYPTAFELSDSCTWSEDSRDMMVSVYRSHGASTTDYVCHAAQFCEDRSVSQEHYCWPYILEVARSITAHFNGATSPLSPRTS